MFADFLVRHQAEPAKIVRLVLKIIVRGKYKFWHSISVIKPKFKLQPNNNIALKKSLYQKVYFIRKYIYANYF